MVDFGPWQQEPDFDVIDVYDPTNDPGRIESRTNTVEGFDGPREGDGSGVPPYLITWGGDVEPAILAAQASNGDAYGQMDYDWDYALSHPNYTASWGATASDNVFTVSPPAEGFYFSEGVADPEDAIGIQYEGRAWSPDDPWSLDVDTYLGPEFIVDVKLGYDNPAFDNTRLISIVGFHDRSGFLDGYPTNELTQPSVTAVYAQVGAGAPQLIAEVTVPPDESSSVSVDLPAPGVFDLPAEMQNNGWSCTLFCRTQRIPPRRAPDALPYSSSRGAITYGVKFSAVQVLWSVRALRYRWVYDELPVITGQVGEVRRRFNTPW